MPGSITAANAIIMLSVPGVFPTPQQLQGFAADDVFDTEALQSSEVVMGVDRRLSGGFVAVAVVQNYKLQADSLSNFFFDQWWAAEQVGADTFPAQGIVVLRSVGQKWSLTKGFLTGYKPIPDAKKLLQPRNYQITWESVLPQRAAA